MGIWDAAEAGGQASKVEQKEVDAETAAALKKALRLEAFYSELTPEQVREVFPASGLFLYPQGSTVIAQGDTSKDLFVIRSGRVAIQQKMGFAGAEMGQLGVGELFGEMALVRDEARVASAVAEEDSLIFRLVEADFKALLTNNAELAAHLKGLAEKRLYG